MTVYRVHDSIEHSFNSKWITNLGKTKFEKDEPVRHCNSQAGISHRWRRGTRTPVQQAYASATQRLSVPVLGNIHQLCYAQSTPSISGIDPPAYISNVTYNTEDYGLVNNNCR